MNKDFDVLVAGAGPAGSAAAIILAGAGLSVAILEKEAFPRNKLCGGLLTTKTMWELERLTGLDPKGLAREGVIDYATDGYEIHYGGKLIVRDWGPETIHFVRREVFDAFLARKAREAGAELLEMTAVRNCDPEQTALETMNGDKFKARYIIGADGVHSQVRKCFPAALINKGRWLRRMASTIEIEIPSGHLPRPEHIPAIYGRVVEAGYGWVFPNRDRLVVGMGALRCNGNNLCHAFRRFLHDLGLPREKWPEFKGYSLPFGNYLSHPVHGATLLVGDSAGLVEPLFGEGIYYALATGTAAAEAVLEHENVGTSLDRAYVGRLRRRVYPDFRYTRMLRRVLFGMEKFSMLTPASHSLKLLCRPLSEAVHGVRSWYSWRRKSPPKGVGVWHKD